MAYEFPHKYHIYPKENIESAIQISNELGWHISLVQGSNGRWYVATGGEEQHATFISDERYECEAFIFGMALMAATVPEDIYKEMAKRFVDDL